MSAATEQTPLLSDLEKARKAAPTTADENRVFQMSRFVNANKPWYMMLLNIGMCILNVSTVIGAYFFVLANIHYTPKCYEYNDSGQAHMRVLCWVTSFCFWTYPLVCTLVVVLVFAKNLYDTRLYYESILHRCILDFRNAAVSETPILWVLLVWGVLALGAFCFVVDRIDQESLSTELFGAAAYLAPVISFAIVFGSQWQIEANLIPLPKFCETDPNFAAELLKQGTYVPELHFRLAFEEVEEALAIAERPLEPMQSHEYFGMLLEAAKKEMTASLEKEKDRPSPESQWNWFDRVLANRGMAPVEDYSIRYGDDVRRPELLSFGQSVRKGGYWAYRLLHSRHLKDARAHSFRVWSRAYLVFIAISVFFFITSFTSTSITFLTYQRIISADSTLSRYFRLVSGAALEGNLISAVVNSPTNPAVIAAAGQHKALQAGLSAALAHFVQADNY